MGTRAIGVVTSNTIETGWDEITAARFQSLRKRGSGIMIRTTRPTPARMARILRLLGLTPSQHGDWCGLTLKQWLAANPHFSERQWAEICCENFDQILAGTPS